MLESSQIFAYIFTLSIAALIPGPGMTALVSRSVSGGFLAGYIMLAGLILGDLVYLSLAVFGLVATAQYFSPILIMIGWISALYLGWLAWQLMTCSPQAVIMRSKTTKRELVSALASGFTITLGNPKTISFYLAVLPFVISLDMVSLQVWGTLLTPITIVVLLIAGSVFIIGAVKVRNLLSSQIAQTRLFRTAGVIMLGASISMIMKII